jgi:7,8-dihydropterin-6-yl-methyl-4-(beta-D-ribofuranosyl)aminobenzene 5'-phosphate synthase
MLTTAWGFACLIETAETTVLFDTGGDAEILLDNAASLDKDLSGIDVVVLSHHHEDHTGGLSGLLSTGITPTVTMLASFPASLRRAAAERATVVEITDSYRIGPGIWTTGEVGGFVPEQALVVETTEGWVLITGCAHPGVDKMAERALETVEGTLHLVLGGYHLSDASPGSVRTTIAALRALDVARVAPTHCTGDAARRAFAEAYGGAYEAVGVGASWTFQQPRRSEEPRLQP